MMHFLYVTYQILPSKTSKKKAIISQMSKLLVQCFVNRSILGKNRPIISYFDMTWLQHHPLLVGGNNFPPAWRLQG